MLKIAEDAAKNLGIFEHLDDIILTGSICSYNWHNLSDVDLHLVLDFKKVDKNSDLVKRYLNSEKTVWNKNHDIMIRGHEVEIYFQSIGINHELISALSQSNKIADMAKYAGQIPATDQFKRDKQK